MIPTSAFAQGQPLNYPEIPLQQLLLIARQAPSTFAEGELRPESTPPPSSTRSVIPLRQKRMRPEQRNHKTAALACLPCWPIRPAISTELTTCMKTLREPEHTAAPPWAATEHSLLADLDACTSVHGTDTACALPYVRLPVSCANQPACGFAKAVPHPAVEPFLRIHL